MQLSDTRSTPTGASSKKTLSPGKLLDSSFTYGLLIFFSLVFLIPFIWMVVSSFKTQSQLFHFPPEWIPNPFTTENYVNMFELVPMAQFVKNSLLVTVLSTAGSVATSAMVGYGFARLRAPGMNLLFGICLATMMLPGQVTMIPLFVIFSKMNWIDTHFPLWVPAWFGGGAYNIFLFRQFFSSIPRELEEAAMIDGASRLGIFAKIIIPNSKAVFAVVAAFAIQYAWTDIFNPVIFLNSKEKFTLALGLTTLIGARVSYIGALMAGSLLMTMPMIVLYFLAQRYIAEGVVTSGIKG